MICGACERELPDDSYSVEQRALRQSVRRCEGCVSAGNQLVLMKKGRTRSEGDDDCAICQLPLPLDVTQSSFRGWLRWHWLTATAQQRPSCVVALHHRRRSRK